MKKMLIGLLVLLFVFSVATSKEVGGINMPDNLKSGNENLVLNGAGVVKKFLFKVYAIGLYLDKKNNNAGSILSQEKNMTIRMHFLRGGISDDKIIDGWNTGFKKATGGKLDPIKNEITTFNGWFKGMEVAENGSFVFEYIPSEGTKVYINGKLKGTIKGSAFKKALFGIWIGNDPRDEGVKESMLGK